MTNFNGVIIEESLENKDVLQRVKIIKTKVEEVTEEHGFGKKLIRKPFDCYVPAIVGVIKLANVVNKDS